MFMRSLRKVAGGITVTPSTNSEMEVGGVIGCRVSEKSLKLQLTHKMSMIIFFGHSNECTHTTTL